MDVILLDVSVLSKLLFKENIEAVPRHKIENTKIVKKYWYYRANYFLSSHFLGMFGVSRDDASDNSSQKTSIEVGTKYCNTVDVLAAVVVLTTKTCPTTLTLYF